MERAVKGKDDGDKGVPTPRHTPPSQLSLGLDLFYLASQSLPTHCPYQMPRVPRTGRISCSSRLGGPCPHPPVSTRRMSMSRMKVALINSQNQRPCVSRKWMKEGLGRNEVRSQVHRSAARAVGATQSCPPGRTRSSQGGRWELGTRARMGQGRTSGVEVRMGVMTHDKARTWCEDGPGPGPGSEGGAGQ